MVIWRLIHHKVALADQLAKVGVELEQAAVSFARTRNEDAALVRRGVLLIQDDLVSLAHLAPLILVLSFVETLTVVTNCWVTGAAVTSLIRCEAFTSAAADDRWSHLERSTWKMFGQKCFVPEA